MKEWLGDPQDLEGLANPAELGKVEAAVQNAGVRAENVLVSIVALFLCACIHGCAYVCMCMRVCLMCVRMCMCMIACVCLCVCACVCVGSGGSQNAWQ